jgi:hypothetical protein
LDAELNGTEEKGKKGDKDYVAAKEGVLSKMQKAEKAFNTAHSTLSKAEAALTKNKVPSAISKLLQDIDDAKKAVEQKEISLDRLSEYTSLLEKEFTNQEESYTKD